MLARVTEFDGDVDIGIESKLPKLEFDQELKDCVAESRRVLRRESPRESLRAWPRVQVCLRESLQGSFRVWIRVCIQVCLHAERECCVRAMVNQLRVDSRDCERMQVQMAHTSVALDKANASAVSAVFHTPRAVAMFAAKGKQFELWPLEVRVGAKRECLSKLVARLKHDRVDDDAENARDEEVLCDCFFHSTTQTLEYLR